jgi:hypothetical protein
MASHDDPTEYLVARLQQKKHPSRAVRRIIDAILNKCLNDKQRVVALRKASVHHEVRRYFMSAGLIDNDEFKTLKHMGERIKGLLQETMKTENPQGRATDEKKALVESIVFAISNPPPDDHLISNNEKSKTPSKASQLKILGIPKSTGMYKKAEQKRNDQTKSLLKEV